MVVKLLVLTMWPILQKAYRGQVGRGRAGARHGGSPRQNTFKHKHSSDYFVLLVDFQHTEVVVLSNFITA